MPGCWLFGSDSTLIMRITGNDTFVITGTRLRGVPSAVFLAMNVAVLSASDLNIVGAVEQRSLRDKRTEFARSVA